MDKIIQHVQLPNREDGDDLSPKDQLIYLAIKRHAKNNKAYPSQDTISKESGASRPTIKKSIDNLEKLNYLRVEKEGRKNVYIFNPYKQFEVFSYEFLDNPNLTFTEKAYLVSTQQFMLEKDTGLGKVSYSNQELSKKINMPESTISKCNRTLQRKEFLTVIENYSRDIESGCPTTTKIFDLEKFGQGLVKAILNHENRLVTIEDEIRQMKEDREKMEKTIEMLQRQLASEQANRYEKAELIVD